MENQCIQIETISYILNRSSIIELLKGNNKIFCQNEILSLNAEQNEWLPLFHIECIENLIYITPLNHCITYVNGIVTENKIAINNRAIIMTDNNTEFLVFKVCVNPVIEIIDEQEILVHFIETGEIPKGTGFDLLRFLKNGARKLQIDEFFSIIAQVDVPEIDQ
jgi:hypothetical protein